MHRLIATLLFFLAFFPDLKGLRRVLFLDHPVENEVVFVSHAVEEVLEELSQIADVGLLLEFKAAAVVHVNRELLGVALGESFNRG